MNLLATHRRAEALRDQLTQELSDKMTLTDDERSAVRDKWFGGNVLEKLEEPPQERKRVVKCPSKHELQAADAAERAWLCQGGDSFGPPCDQGSHTGAAQYRCVHACAYDGLCEAHYQAALAKLKQDDENNLMMTYIHNRSATRPRAPGGELRNVSPPRRHGAGYGYSHGVGY